MPTPCYITNARIVDPSSGRDSTGDLFVHEGRFARLPEVIPDGTLRIDAHGLVAVPGLIDLHVHLREPGQEDAETVETGCRAAARGGFTAIVAMPNTLPAMDAPGQVAALLDRAAACNLVHVWPAPCITRERKGRELTDFRALVQAGAVAFTDDGSTVTDDLLMEAAMRQSHALDRPVFDHALDPKLAGRGVMHAGTRSAGLDLPGISSEAETVMVARDIRLAEVTGCAVHIQHLSAAGSVTLVREARRRGVPVSAELTPHHLALTDDDVRPNRADRFKMNPPLRTDADRAALIEAVCDGTIACFATDHAPHTAESKARGFVGAPFGVIGLETAVGVTYSLLVKNGRMALTDWLTRWTLGPARILGRPSPSLAIGAPADFALLDLSSEWTVRADAFASKSRNTPFDGWTLSGQARWTFRGGNPIHGGS